MVNNCNDGNLADFPFSGKGIDVSEGPHYEAVNSKDDPRKRGYARKMEKGKRPTKKQTCNKK